MPGEYDPSNLMLPQQPLHHAMFTRAFASAHKQNLHTATNPYSFSLNVKNVKKEEEEEEEEIRACSGKLVVVDAEYIRHLDG